MNRIAATFKRLLALVRRASAAIYRALVLVLLIVFYVTVLPGFALGFRLFAARRTGWRTRQDVDVASLERLRSPS